MGDPLKHDCHVLSRSVAFAVLVGILVAPASWVRGQGHVPDPGVIVSTLAGAVPGSPLNLYESDIWGLVRDESGAFFIYDSSQAVIWRRGADGALTTIAGAHRQRGSVDGTGSAARFTYGRGMARDHSGNLYLTSYFDYTVRKVTPAGVVTTLAGRSGERGSVDGLGAAARFADPGGLTVDPAGVVYVVDNAAIRRITPEGLVTTVAGVSHLTGSVDGVGTAARFAFPQDIVMDEAGNLFVVEVRAVRKVTPDWNVTTIAGNGTEAGFVDGSGSSARFHDAFRVAYNGSGTLYVSDRGNCAIRLVTTSGVVTTHPSAGRICPAGEPNLRRPNGIALGGDGTVYALLHDRPTALVAISPSGTVTDIWPSSNAGGTVAGTGAAARFNLPHAIATERGGSFWVAQGPALRRVSAGGVVTNVGLFNYPGFPELFSLTFQSPVGGVGVGAGDVAFVTLRCQVARVRRTSGAPSFTVGSSSECGSADGSATSARFRNPEGIAVGHDGTLYVADTGNHTIRTITTGGVVRTLAGTAGSPGSADGVGAGARFNRPVGIAVNADGVVFVTDADNHTIRRIAADGTVTTLAGVAGVAGTADGTGPDARFHLPDGISVHSSGLLAVADSGNHRIRLVTTTGAVTTAAGATAIGSADGHGDQARFMWPEGVAFDESGTVFVADTGNNTIRQLLRSTAAAPTITTHPADATITETEYVQFTCAATGGVPTHAYQWQVSTDRGTTWSNLTEVEGVAMGTETTTVSIGGGSRRHNNRYRCVAANSVGSVVSDAAVLTVNGMTAMPTQLEFGGVTAGAGGALISVTPPQTVRVAFGGAVAPQWTASSNRPWIQVTGGSGTGNGTFQVSIVNPDNAIGTATRLTGNVLLTSSNTSYTASVFVVLDISPSGTSAAPLGNFDTPSDGSTGLSGAVVVSGWAIDDVAVERVEIWRDWVPGEPATPYSGPGPGNGKVFIANGLFVDGTRPDVESLYHAYPRAYRGGWGYVLLTYGFPNAGNGTFTLHAYAYDAQGNITTLGAKTISVNNADATKPFGTIDIPNSGEEISGQFGNHGWVLTPAQSGSSCSVAGGQVWMTVDSGALTNPVIYGLQRPDVSAAFPGLADSAAPGAVVNIDTTQYANGLHALGWLVVDSCGRSEGIGSRFINVQNGTGGDVAHRPTRALDALGLSETPSSTLTVRLDVLERGIVELPAIDGASWSGYEIVSGEARRLPIGSSLDAVAGRFYWTPAPGFFGSFALRFVAHVGGAPVADVAAHVIVGPTVRMRIETPQPDANTSMNFTIEGWVADVGAAAGTGIDAVHVWAYPHTGAGPIFAGHADVGLRRPDIAAAHGARFDASGFRLSVAHLPRGVYDLVVYPHSSVDGSFTGAQMIRIHVR